MPLGCVGSIMKRKKEKPVIADDLIYRAKNKRQVAEYQYLLEALVKSTCLNITNVWYTQIIYLRIYSLHTYKRKI